VIFAHDADLAVEEALTDLTALLKGQAGDHFRLYESPTGWRRDKDTEGRFLPVTAPPIRIRFPTPSAGEKMG